MSRIVTNICQNTIPRAGLIYKTVQQVIDLIKSLETNGNSAHTSRFYVLNQVVEKICLEQISKPLHILPCEIVSQNNQTDFHSHSIAQIHAEKNNHVIVTVELSAIFFKDTTVKDIIDIESNFKQILPDSNITFLFLFDQYYFREEIINFVLEKYQYIIINQEICKNIYYIPENFDSTVDFRLKKLEEVQILNEQHEEKIQEFKELFDHMMEGYALHQLVYDSLGNIIDYKFLEINPAYEKLTGLNRSVLGKTASEVLPDTEIHWITIYSNVVLSGEPIIFEKFSYDYQRYFKISVFRTGLHQFAISMKDITDRVYANKELFLKSKDYISLINEYETLTKELKILYDQISTKNIQIKESEQRYRSIAENSNVAICEISEDCEILYINDAYNHLLGYKPADLVGKKLAEIICTQDHNIFNVAIENIISNGKPSSDIWRFSDNNGENKWFESFLNVYIDYSGYKRIVLISSDIDTRKRAEEALRVSEEKYRQLVDLSPIGIIIHVNGVVEMLNQAAKKILYIEKEEIVIGKNAFEFVHPAYHEQSRKRIEHSLNTGKISPFSEAKLIRLDGIVIDVEIAGTPLIYKGRQAMQTIFLDISSRKQLEKELIKAKKKAEESDRLKSAFLANMSHEIRTPMNGILGFAQLLLEPDVDENKRASYVNIINEQGNYLLHLINDIIDISKIEAGQFNIVKSNMYINKMINMLYEFFSNTLKVKEKHNVKLIMYKELPDDSDVIFTDELRVQQIFINLIGNSVKFTNKGFIKFGYTVKQNQKGKYIYFFVQDSGVGIPAEQQSVIFERFRQAEGSNYAKNISGTGLGLAISKAIVELLGGEIRVASEVGKGSEFSFIIPV